MFYSYYSMAKGVGRKGGTMYMAQSTFAQWVLTIIPTYILVISLASRTDFCHDS